MVVRTSSTSVRRSWPHHWSRQEVRGEQARTQRPAGLGSLSYRSGAGDSVPERCLQIEVWGGLDTPFNSR
jgi:hypothetical protein